MGGFRPTVTFAILLGSAVSIINVACESQLEEGVYHMVIAGDSSWGGIIDDVELVSLDPDVPVPPCLTNLNKFPVKTRSAAGSVGEDGLPFVCGGRTEPGYSDICYKYSPLDDSWQQHGTLPSERADSASAHVENMGLVMVGGYSSGAGLQKGASLDSVIVTRDGVNFEALASLPEGRDSGCLAVIDNQTLLHSGGVTNPGGGSNVGFQYDIPRNEWTRVEDFLAPYRFNHGCGTISAQDGNKEGVAAGGQVVGFADTVEIYSVADGNWRYVNNLPLDLVHAESVPFKESFVLFGGLFYEDLQPLDTILHYIPSNDTWVEMNVRLRTPRGYTTVIPVKRSIFPPC